jgi:hypothetical protein
LKQVFTPKEEKLTPTSHLEASFYPKEEKLTPTSHLEASFYAEDRKLTSNILKHVLIYRP